MVITGLSMMILVIFQPTLVLAPAIPIPTLGSVVTDGYRGVILVIVICIPRSVLCINSWLRLIFRCCTCHHAFSVASSNLDSPLHGAFSFLWDALVVVQRSHFLKVGY